MINSANNMPFRITFSLLVLLLLCSVSSGDPTILLNAPMGVPGGGGLYGTPGLMHSPFLFDRDDVDVILGAPGYGPPVYPASASPIAQPPTILVLDRPQTNKDMSSPIPGVRYVVPGGRSSRRSSPYYRRSRSYRRRYGYYG